MNTNTNVFAFGENVVRVAGTPEKPLFVAADVCRILEIEQPGSALREFDDDEKGMQTLHTLGGPQEVLVVTEPGLYRLIFRSYKPAAAQFRRWVFHEVLPAIRKTGAYGAYGVTREKQLFAALTLAKTGAVQLAILGALGITIPERAPRASEAYQPRPVVALDVQKCWHDIAQGIGFGLMKGCYRMEVLGEAVFTLYLCGGEVLEVLKEWKRGEYGMVDGLSFRKALATSEAWVPGYHKQRIDGPAKTLWRFDITVDDVELMAVVSAIRGK